MAVKNKLSGMTNAGDGKQEIERLAKERDQAENLLDRAMDQKIEYDEPAAIKAADKKVRQYSKQITDIDRQLRRIDQAQKLQNCDLDKEVDAALAVLDDWSLLTACTPSKKLQRLIGVLRPTITIQFDHKPGQRPKYQPREAAISFEPDMAIGDVRGHMKDDCGPELTPVIDTGSAGRKRTVTKGNRGDRISPFVNVRHEAVLVYLAGERLTLPWSEIAAGSGIKQAKPRVGRTNSPAHALRRLGYRTIGEVCAASGVSDSTLVGWEGRFVPVMKKVNGVRVIAAKEFDRYVSNCIRIREQRCRNAEGVKAAQKKCELGCFLHCVTL